jgi:hypothetical protein
MLEALWSVEFGFGDTVLGSGVVVIDNGKVLGGDTAFLFVGWVHVVEDTVTADLQVKKYRNTPGMASITGLDNYQVKLVGKKDPTAMVLKGASPNGLSLFVRLQRQAELP